MKASTRFVLRTLVIAGISVGLGLAFNATRPESLPLVQTREKPAPVVIEAAEAPAEAPPVAGNASAPEAAGETGTPEAPLAADAAPEGADNASVTEQTMPFTEADNATAPAEAEGSEDAGNASDALQPPADASLEPAPADAEPALPEGGEISLQDAARLFASGQAVFVDARDAGLFAEGHIEGALSLSPYSFVQDFPALEDSLRGKTVVTYCDGERCTLSAELAELLRAQGLENVYELHNGWTLWLEQGLPTATGQNPEHGGGQS